MAVPILQRALEALHRQDMDNFEAATDDNKPRGKPSDSRFI